MQAHPTMLLASIQSCIVKHTKIQLGFPLYYYIPEHMHSLEIQGSILPFPWSFHKLLYMTQIVIHQGI